MFGSAILVLLYNCELEDSKTLQTLKKCHVTFGAAKLVIWNNGPKRLSSVEVSFLSECNLDISIKQTIENESLAVIYNQFLGEYKANAYIFLDHDSTLNADYLTESLQVKKGVVGVPKILSDGKITSPTINGAVYANDIEINPYDKVVSIGSGLIVSKEVVVSLSEKYGKTFDERFYLYGVDTTFFYRIYDSGLTSKIKIISGFEHSLSRLEVESNKTKKFRRLERACDKAMTFRYYSPPIVFLYSVVLISWDMFKRTLRCKEKDINYFAFIKAAICGKHYRNVK
jgi:hypothetical protein